MKRITHALTVTLLPLVTLLLGLQLGMRLEQNQLQQQFQDLEFLYKGGTGSGQTIMNPAEEVNPAILWSIWRLLLAHYIHPEDLKVEPMLYGAVAGLVQSIGDPYSMFMTPSENKEFHESLNGTLQGIGAELTFRDGMIVIVAPIKGSPAARAGLLPGDMILAVDGEEIQGQTLQQVVGRIRGPKGTRVRLTIQREGKWTPQEMSILRAEITIPSVEHELKETGSGAVGYIAINQFAEHTNKEVERVLKELKEKPLKGIILDVRFNGGGYLDRAVDLASMFLRQGKVVSVARREGEPETHYVYGRPIDTDTPLVILINQGSASASEILAGALQDHKRATVIGEPSFGKGTVQEIFELPGGASLRVTVAKWLTPNGRDLSKEGVEPDIEIKRTAEDMEEERDPQLERAMEWLLTREALQPAPAKITD
ncbi:MAG: S41 family peptidase [Candidatus Peribacteraceae bacterium]|nr:S41 family peptidase [Candidatus Peribacteraceae bacterium]